LLTADQFNSSNASNDALGNDLTNTNNTQTMENINTEKLIRYINDWAEESEKQADKWGANGYILEAHKAEVIAEFLREDFVRGIEMDLMNEEK